MFIKLLGIFFASFALATLAHAEGAEPGTYQLEVGGFSYHMPHNKKRNEKNYGLGLQYQWTENTAFTVGAYQNSLDRRSGYIFAQYHPWEFYGVRFGATGGLVTGYQSKNHNTPMPVILPSASVQFKYVGVEALLLPPIAGRQGVFWVGFKIPLKGFF